MKRTLILGLAGTAVAVAAVGGVAYADDSSSTGLSAPNPATSTAPAAPAKAKHPRLRAAAERALHGQFTVERKGQPVLVDVQRGTVTSADPSSVTVQSKDGFSATYAITSTTKIRDNKAAAPAGDLTVGKKVGVLADDAAGHPTARAIRVQPAK